MRCYQIRLRKSELQTAGSYKNILGGRTLVLTRYCCSDCWLKGWCSRAVRWPWLSEVVVVHVAKARVPPNWALRRRRRRGPPWASPQRLARSDALTTAPCRPKGRAFTFRHLSLPAFDPARLLKQLKTQVSSEVGQRTVLQPVISKDSKYKSSSQNETEMKHDKREQVSEKVLESFGLFIVKPAEEAKRIKHPEARLKVHKHFLL